MDDFDSFSTVVKDTPAQDDFDSFSTVVKDTKATPKGVAPKAPAVKPKVGMMDKAKALLSEGADNLGKEIKNGTLVDNGVRGLIHGGLSIAGGIGQLAARGLESGANYIAPGSELAKWAHKSRVLTEQDNQRLEDAYQRDTKGSVVAGVGRVAGEVAMPIGAATKAEKGATLAQKVGNMAYNGGKVAALQPVYDAQDKTGAQYAGAKAGQMAVGAALGAAAPVAGKVAMEAGAKLPGKVGQVFEQALTDTRKAQLFDKSPNAKADAEVISELGGVKDRVGSRKLLTQDLNARQSRISEQTKDAMKAAGATPEQLTQLKTWQGMTAAEKEQFRNTEMGAPVAAIMDKLDRIRALTPGELSSNLLGPVRGALDLAPIPAPVRYGLKNALGGRTTRAESAAKMLDARSQRAAAQYLEANGASDATKGMQTLQDMGAAAKARTDADSLLQQRLQFQNKAMTDNPSMLVPSLADPVERDFTMSNLKQSIMNRDKEMTRNARLMAKQNANSPDLVVPSVSGPADKAATKTLKDDMIARAREQADADKAAQAAKEAAKVQAMKLVARKTTGTPGGGGYQALLEHTGLPPKELNQHLRTLSNHPELADEVNKIRVGGGNTSDGAIYPITDLVNKLAGKDTQGALSQVQPSGVLSGETERLTARYQMATKTRQGMYDKAKADAAGIENPQVRSEVADLAEKLKSTPERTERVKMIDELIAKYPEAKPIFSAVRKFK